MSLGSSLREGSFFLFFLLFSSFFLYFFSICFVRLFILPYNICNKLKYITNVLDSVWHTIKIVTLVDNIYNIYKNSNNYTIKSNKIDPVRIQKKEKKRGFSRNERGVQELTGGSLDSPFHTHLPGKYPVHRPSLLMPCSDEVLGTS